jgi:hypothetical protein
VVGHPVADELAGAVKDSDGIYFVPAFSGLMSPHWREDARGSDLALSLRVSLCFGSITACLRTCSLLIGLTYSTTNQHIARAVLEAVAYQTRDVSSGYQHLLDCFPLKRCSACLLTQVLDAMVRDSHVSMTVLKVDGGMTARSLIWFLCGLLPFRAVNRAFTAGSDRLTVSRLCAATSCCSSSRTFSTSPSVNLESCSHPPASSLPVFILADAYLLVIVRSAPCHA